MEGQGGREKPEKERAYGQQSPIIPFVCLRIAAINVFSSCYHCFLCLPYPLYKLQYWPLGPGLKRPRARNRGSTMKPGEGPGQTQRGTGKAQGESRESSGEGRAQAH